MRFFGLEITRTKAAPQPLSSVDTSRGWFPLIREPWTGAWQRNREIRVEDGLCNPTVFACVSLISGDFSKLRVKLMAQAANDIWSEVESPAFSPVLRKPNRYQTRNQFFENWAASKQLTGNTVVLKERDERGVVTSLYILDWRRVKPLTTPDGSVYYQLSGDRMAGLEQDVTVPASEIIHDRWNCFYHPLVGLSPLYAAGLLVLQGQEILGNSAKFFANGSKPGGVLTAPGEISDDTAKRLKERWEENYTGENAGRVAVLGNGLTYEAMALSAAESQLIEQLKWTDEKLCGIFRVPGYMIGVGAEPLNNNVEALALGYYSRCLQVQIEAAETALDEGLGIGRGVKKDGVVYGTEFDLDGLLRMDAGAMMAALDKGKNVLTPNEARQRVNLGPKTGGDSVYRQQQDFSLEALSKRDAKDDPFASGKTAAAAPVDVPANEDTPSDAQAAKALAAIYKGLAHV